MLGQASLFKHAIRGMARFDMLINWKGLGGDRAKPYFVITLALTLEIAAVRQKDFLQRGREVVH